ncbi:MAG: DMT family transporter [Chloroflexi bacterium]|jgi:drug/metabolite transporter (DMT)-like permease|nr:DMT family transporter [Anaerolineaceae bacterium]NLI43902.1 DMT family transporter [Chloroflexota bacterium]HOE35553.1 DMT family transporter [Anaerolineaceae bacterium]HOT24959.1 DMT family transporter [Anaerolineaceae bacterium]HQH57553.1 DMT family transporter [Anaerolineaceae bacterium]
MIVGNQGTAPVTEPDTRRPRNGSFILLLTSIIWGSSFVPQRVAMESMRPFTYTAARFLLGAAVLLPVLFLRNRTKQTESRAADLKTYLFAGLLCGSLLFLGVSFQQTGIQYTEAGKAGFISALYVVLVPLLGIPLGKRANSTVWLGVLLAVAGVYLLSFTNQFRIERGDLFVLMGTLFWAAHILTLDRFLPKVDGLALAIMQFFAAGFLALIAALIFEKPHLAQLSAGLWTILYSGILVVGGGYTLQVLGQKSVHPTIAALIMSTESVFAVLFGWILLGELLSLREITGCAVMFAAVVIAQLPGQFARKIPAISDGQPDSIN